MLLERIHHYNNLHFSMNLVNVAEEAPHYHNEMELVLVLRGNVRYKVHHQTFFIKAGDIFVVDTKDLHYIYESSEDVIMLQFHVDMAHFEDTYPNIDVMFFVCEEYESDSPKWQQRLRNKIAFLAHHIAEMMLLCQEGGNDDILEEKLEEFLYIMVDKFQAFFIENNEFHQGNADMSPVDLERLYGIMHYMYANFDKKITLEDISQLEHLSVHYISHFIKKTSGLSFQNLLNYIRVEQAERLLNENRYTLTQISELCGFSSPAYFNKCFHSWHGITPAEYKKQPRPTMRSYHTPFSQSEAILLLQGYLNTDLPSLDELTEGYSTNHIVIPVTDTSEEHIIFSEVFKLSIAITDTDSLMRSVYYVDELCKLSPGTVNISKDAISSTPDGSRILQILKDHNLNLVLTDSNHPLHPATQHINSAAAAFAAIINNKTVTLKLFDDNAGLFTSGGLPTAYYSVFNSFNDIYGNIIEQNDKYLIVKNNEYISLIIHSPINSPELNLHIQFDNGNKPSYIAKTIFDSEKCSYATVKHTQLNGIISYSLRKHFFDLAKGSASYIPADTLKNLRLNVAMNPDTLMFMYFYPYITNCT